MYRTKLVALGLCVFILSFGFSTYQVKPTISPTATFVIAQYAEGDEYSQGIRVIYALVNDEYNQTVFDLEDSYNPILEVNLNDTVSLKLNCWLNQTLTGVANAEAGKAIIRHNLTVYSNNNTLVFSKYNFTWVSPYAGMSDMIMYSYTVDLDFTFAYEEIYTIKITYEVFY